jgi:hypothetical protein
VKSGAARPPELIGFVKSITVLDSGEVASSNDVTLSTGDCEGSVVLLFPTDHGDRGSLVLTTKQAYHLGSALMRARARALRSLS